MTKDLQLLPLRGEKILSHARKTGPWYLLEVLFKISNEHPRSPSLPPGEWCGVNKRGYDKGEKYCSLSYKKKLCICCVLTVYRAFGEKSTKLVVPTRRSSVDAVY